MSTFINDTIGLLLVGLGILITIALRRANHRSPPPGWVVAELPTLIAQTVAVGVFSVGLGLFLHSTFG